jgi:hypothetical protein
VDGSLCGIGGTRNIRGIPGDSTEERPTDGQDRRAKAKRASSPALGPVTFEMIRISVGLLSTARGV